MSKTVNPAALRDGATFEIDGLPLRLDRVVTVGPEGGKIPAWNVWAVNGRRVVEWAPTRTSAVESAETAIRYYGVNFYKNK